ncbi:hypothetical protein [Lichenifustis flavocetrariae]|uniref:Uncharacterized protein n=1 Tax=Lichenifustis flavocetrariae TaxID=2949735 RepID=A0AA41YYV5_9HYPH|nr:hypothetical protein [Lichenifustis flavocetrariae]MCW6507403.1 hypothetical protein [Lichenifustis flavocetrariae]
MARSGGKVPATKRPRGGGGGLEAQSSMMSVAQSLAELARLLFQEMSRKKPRDAMVERYSILFQDGLTELRIAANGGDVAAARDIGEVQKAVAAALPAGNGEPVAIMLLARAFAEAQLDPGPALRDVMMQALADLPEASEDESPEGSVDPFSDLAAALGDDPFALHAELAATGSALPSEHRAAMATLLAASPNPTVCKSTLGFALSPDAVVAHAALTALKDAKIDGPVATVLSAWLMQIRFWVGEKRRPEIDAAIRSLRAKSSQGVERPPRSEVRLVLASICDGAGAQSLFAMVKRGRRFAVACVLVKLGTGIADAWIRDALTKADAEAFINDVLAGVESVEISMVLFERRLADALVAHLDTGTPPPFHLLQAMDVLGLSSLRPDASPPAVLAEALLAGLPADLTGPAAVEDAHRRSLTWMQEFETVASWFEAGEDVEALLRPLKSRKQRLVAVTTKLLPGRRKAWAERCAWTSAVLKEEAEPDELLWVDFALVSRDLAGTRPLEEIPLAGFIASATVEAFLQR